MQSKIKTEPKYLPHQEVFCIIKERIVSCSVSSINTRQSINDFNITYDCYFDLADIGIFNNGSPSKMLIIKNEDSLYESVELLKFTIETAAEIEKERSEKQNKKK
jgi:hypothetical protein